MYSVKSYINLIFTSNKSQPVRIPMGDRRFNVGKYQAYKWEPTPHEIDVLIPSELEGFTQYLMTRKADIKVARTIMQTDDRAAIQALGVTSVDEFANDVLTGNLAKLWEYMPDERMMNEHGLVDVTASTYASLLKRYFNESMSRITRDELAMLFRHAIGKVPEGANKFTSFLRHHCITTKKMWINGVSSYGVEVTWTSKPDYQVTPPEEKKLRKVK